MAHKFVNLQTAAFTADLAEAPIYAKFAIVRAWQMVPQARALLMEHGGSDLYDIYVEGEELMLRTFVMVEGEDGERKRKLECVRRLEDGDWIVLNPQQQEGDYPNRYAMGNDTFRKKYERKEHSWLTVDGDQFRAKGMARIIPNPYGEPITVSVSWGTQDGNADCYVCAFYDRAHPDEVSSDRYLLSENDFAAYKPAAEVLGEDWED